MGISIIERWESDNNSQKITVCINCKNYLNDLTCKAFPNGIPNEILNTSNDHSKPLPDQQNDIVFEPETK